MRLAHRVPQGSGLVVLIRFAVSPAADAPVAWIEFHGTVLRIEPQPGSAYGTALRLTHHRFVYTTTQQWRS